VQNFPKFVCRPAFVCRNYVRITHGRLWLGMPQPVQTDRHGRTNLIEQRSIAVPESVETALPDA